MRTGPLTFKFLSLAALTNSLEMRSMAEQFLEVMVMRILCSYEMSFENKRDKYGYTFLTG